jgi:alpha-tubulin suppressor-like RCC1 family protein
MARAYDLSRLFLVGLLGALTQIAYFRRTAKMVAAGQEHTCALRPAGDVVCWGPNSDGQVGAFPTSTSPVTQVEGRDATFGSGADRRG